MPGLRMEAEDLPSPGAQVILLLSLLPKQLPLQQLLRSEPLAQQQLACACVAAPTQSGVASKTACLPQTPSAPPPGA